MELNKMNIELRTKEVFSFFCLVTILFTVVGAGRPGEISSAEDPARCPQDSLPPRLERRDPPSTRTPRPPSARLPST